jgi:hypothetical protein
VTAAREIQAKKAILAVATAMLTAVFFMPRDGVAYKDLGADHLQSARSSNASCGDSTIWAALSQRLNLPASQGFMHHKIDCRWQSSSIGDLGQSPEPTGRPRRRGHLVQIPMIGQWLGPIRVLSPSSLSAYR